MDNNIFILEEKAIAVEVSEQKKLIYLYHLLSKVIDDDTKSILLTIDSESMREINKHFDIDVQEYGVVVEDEVQKEFSKEQKEEIYKDNFIKYLMIIFFFITIYMLNTNDMQTQQMRGENSLGYISLFGTFLVLFFVFTKEALAKDRFTTELKNSITTKALPSKREQIEILESKIDILVKEKRMKND